ncbi:hypothetical protein R0382_002077 [Jeongeupia wiesaeckerbachi]
MAWVCQLCSGAGGGVAGMLGLGLNKFRCPINGLSVRREILSVGVLTGGGEVLKVAFSADDAAKETKRNPLSLPSEVFRSKRSLTNYSR